MSDVIKQKAPNLNDIISSNRDQLLKILRGDQPGSLLNKLARPLPKSYIPNLGNVFSLSASVPIPFGLSPITASIGGGADGLFRIPNSDYFLELYYQGEILTTIGFPFNPSSISITTPETIKLTNTTNRTFRESGLNRMRMITISGQSGFAERLGYARDGGYVFENGEVIMHEFEEFLKGYNFLLSYMSSNTYSNAFIARASNIIQKGREQGDNRAMSLSTTKTAPQDKEYLKQTGNKNNEHIYLVLRCVKENISFKVEVSSFSFSKSVTSNRFGYQYNLVLSAYGIEGPGRRTSLLTGIGDDISGYIRKVAAAAALLQAFQTNLIEDTLDPIQGVANALNTSTSELKSAVGSFGLNYNRVQDKFKKVIATISQSLDKFKTAAINAGNQGLQIGVGIPGSTGVGIGPKAYALKNSENDFRKRSNRNRQLGLEGKTAALDLNAIESELIENQFGLDVRQNLNVKQINNFNAIKEMLNSFDYKNASDNHKIELGLMQSVKNDLFDSRETFKSFVKKEYNSSFDRFNDENKTFENESSVSADNESFDYEIYTLKSDEDLKDLALKIYGDESFYIDIMKLNNWLDATRKSDGSFASGGDLIKLPVVNNFKLFSNDRYLTDLDTSDFDIQLDYNRNDLKLISSLRNLNQGIRNNLLSYTGELRLDLEFGLAGLLGVQNTDFVVTQLNKKLLADDRISKIDVRFIEQKKDYIVVGLNITAVQGEQFDFNTAIDI